MGATQLDGFRLRGKVFKESSHNWFFQISLWNTPATEQFGPPFTVGPFLTERECRSELGRAATLITKSLPIGRIDDAKTGTQNISIEKFIQDMKERGEWVEPSIRRSKKTKYDYKD